jgi:transposase
LHGSYSGIQDFFREVLSLEVSRGYLAKLNQKAAQAFAQPYAQLLSLLPQQVHLNADETGHKENGHRYWTWCFRAKAFIVFKIHASRGSDVLFDILGQNFQGSLGADFWGAYRKYAGQCGVLIQFCLAHLIREVKYLCEFPDPSFQRYIQALLAVSMAMWSKRPLTPGRGMVWVSVSVAGSAACSAKASVPNSKRAARFMGTTCCRR